MKVQKANKNRKNPGFFVCPRGNWENKWLQITGLPPPPPPLRMCGVRTTLFSLYRNSIFFFSDGLGHICYVCVTKSICSLAYYCNALPLNFLKPSVDLPKRFIQAETVLGLSFFYFGHFLSVRAVEGVLHLLYSPCAHAGLLELGPKPDCNFF